MRPQRAEETLNTHLVISAIGEDRPGIVEAVAGAIHDAGCNLEDSRMTVLGGTFAMVLLASGNWNTTTKLEKALDRLGQAAGLTITTQRTERKPPRSDCLPYAIDVIALDQPGIVHELASFFAERGVNIQNMTTATYAAPHTGSPMFSLHMTIEIPGQAHLAGLRDEFLDLCDSFNLDGIMEPVKH
ncbi:glycine cleavage system protein R [Acidihalobacter prosperus]|uniref:glycine cleavage system protein R n=1 Tax=Acidihalobacter prosperus TaxID=160660 RepID=UPI00050658EC|nr:glycine cleavage system protein R [Acidihalobacter prosperus]